MLKYLFRYSSGIGLKIIVSPSDSHGFLEDETDGFYLLSSGIADGAILLEHMAKAQRIEYLKRTGTPYVVLGQPEEQDIPAVSLDNFDVGLKGGGYLKEKGFKKICYQMCIRDRSRDVSEMVTGQKQEASESEDWAEAENIKNRSNKDAEYTV